METNEAIVRTYLEQELTQEELSNEDRTLLNNTLKYVTTKRENQQAAWHAFLQRVEAKKERWKQIRPVDGLSYEYKAYESEGLCSFGMSVGTERYACWVFNIIGQNSPSSKWRLPFRWEMNA